VTDKLNVEDFGRSDIGEAARLLAARHRRDRRRDHRLPSEFETQEVCAPRIEALLPHGIGVAAFRDRRLVGYLISKTAPPHEAHRRAYVPLEGHAIADSETGETYRQMYAALAPQLIRRGLFDHQVHIAALDGLASDAFFTLTFGQGFHVAARPLDNLARAGAICQVRMGGPADIDAVMRLVVALDIQSAEAPSFMPAIGNSPAFRTYLEGALRRTDKVFWLALLDGHEAGMMFAGRPEEPGLDRGFDSAHIFEAIVEDGARSRGIGTTLFQHCLVWARENGYQQLSLDYRSHNLQGVRFWLGHGFTPVSTILQRRLDPRLAWADGSNE
jgi:ribosomal protein S18 acetylase RimI-like enzyme